MKHLFTFFISSLSLLSTTDQQERFIGKWIGSDKGDVGYMIFDEEGFATFEIQDQIIGGKEFIMNGKKGKMTYTVNFRTQPIEVDFTITKLASDESKKILGIVEIKDANTMVINLDFDTAIPTEFGENSIHLKRLMD